jgi:hypothetical protein
MAYHPNIEQRRKALKGEGARLSPALSILTIGALSAASWAAIVAMVSSLWAVL